MPDETPFPIETLDPNNGTYELALRGRVYADVAPQLKDELIRLADRGLLGLLVDARALEQIDSSGLNVFVHLLKKIRPQGGKIVFFGLNPNIARVFNITKLETVVGVEPTRLDGLGALGREAGTGSVAP